MRLGVSISGHRSVIFEGGGPWHNQICAELTHLALVDF